MVVVAIFTAVEAQLRAFDRASRKTEQDRVAYVLLRRMAADLRSAVNPATLSPDATAGSLDSGSSDEDMLDLFAEETDIAWALTLDDTISGPAGLRGEADRLRIDVVRAVPADAATLGAAFWLDSTPTPADSGIRTIEYFVVSPDESYVAADAGQPNTAARGLMRREMVEPVALWAAQLGAIDDSNPAVLPLAPEVVAVEFRYHNGTDWSDTWDSSSSGTLPRAVEITLLLAPEDMSASDIAAWSVGLGLSTTGAETDMRRYRLVVHLPIETKDSSTADAGSGSETAEPGYVDPEWGEEL
jgi:hypothetical protein